MTILESILDVFSSVGEWISESITALMPVFYGESGLTFIGVLAVASLAFSVVFLILGLPRGFFCRFAEFALSIISAHSSQILGQKNPRSYSELPPFQGLRSSPITPPRLRLGRFPTAVPR